MNTPTWGFSTAPLVIGHRGASGHRPENSLAAFELAAAPGPARCDGVEFDIHTTVDGRFVVCHDPMLPTGVEIASSPADHLCAMERRAGRHLPLLEEVLALLGAAGLHAFIEIKGLPPRFDTALIALLESAAAGSRPHLHAFDHRIIARLHRQAPALSLGVLSCSYPVDPVAPAREAGATLLWQESHLVDAELVTSCRQEGIGVVAWTVNDASRAGELARLGVAGLCGDWPERLRPATPEGDGPR